jgi:hypothetical protein
MGTGVVAAVSVQQRESVEKKCENRTKFHALSLHPDPDPDPRPDE